MTATIGILVLLAGLFAWMGQGLSFFFPDAAKKLGVLEGEEDTDPSLSVIEAKAESLMDVLLVWTLPASALLMLLEHPLWPYLALVGSGVYLYFSGLIMLSRVFLKRVGKSVGKPSAERAAYLFGWIWTLSALAMITMAAKHFSG